MYRKKVVVLTNVDGRHYLPGGRLEPGETYLEALGREIEEECGLHIDESELIGFIHFKHLTSRPINYPYPYPDMIHLVYLVKAAGEVRSGDSDGYEEAADLASPEMASTIEGTDFARPFLLRAAEA
jgi:ADP-ribose pyrophosphatase YjhB (NUDIX family)